MPSSLMGSRREGLYKDRTCHIKKVIFREISLISIDYEEEHHVLIIVRQEHSRSLHYGRSVGAGTKMWRRTEHGVAVSTSIAGFEMSVPWIAVR